MKNRYWPFASALPTSAPSPQTSGRPALIAILLKSKDGQKFLYS